VLDLRGFEFHQPGSLEEASRLLRELGQGAMVYAGGTDILPRMRLHKIRPAHLVNIKRIPNLRGIVFSDGRFTIGALTRFNDIIFSPDVNEHLPVLAEVSRTIGSHQVRNLATIGGNLCNAAPSADSAPMLIALGALVRVHAPAGPREILLEDLFKGPGSVRLAPDEILTHILVDKPSPTVRTAYIKHEVRQTLEIAITGVAVALDLAADGACRRARVVVAACAPTPLRARRAESILEGSRLDAETVERAARAASEEITPIDDVRSSARYRREMTAVSLLRAVERAGGGGR
jgi:carbon-monoxide dehydrogenase medium subunit